MNYLGQNELTQVMGSGNVVGEVRQGPDGTLYQWIQGVEGLGNPIGFWRALRRIGQRVRQVARPFVRRVLPLAQRFAPVIPGVGPAVAAGLRVATPLLRRGGVAGSNGLGALYQAPDGTMYHVQGLAEDEELRGLAEDEELRGLGQDELTQVLGLGSFIGEVRQGPDGNLYRWVQGVDGLGNPRGFWQWFRRAREFVRRLRPAFRRVRTVAQRIMPTAMPEPTTAPPTAEAVTPPTAEAGPPEEAATAGWGLGQDELTQVMGIGHPGEIAQGPDGNLYQWVQGVDGLGNPVGFWSAVARVGGRLLRRIGQRLLQRLRRRRRPPTPQPGAAGYDGVGSLYQAPDGTSYQVQGSAEDEVLRGLAEEDELRGVAEDDELRGVAEDEELRGLAEDEELRGLAENEELHGLDQGYVRENGTSGLEAYVPDQPAGTRWFVPPADPPKMWEPLW